mmetsp:Transcript_228/g.576  ORF Transcript_228/g.576 Transcript_228/m.576 type:complete len:262 (+) Transcript_228:1166-1951(+)
MTCARPGQLAAARPCSSGGGSSPRSRLARSGLRCASSARSDAPRIQRAASWTATAALSRWWSPASPNTTGRLPGVEKRSSGVESARSQPTSAARSFRTCMAQSCCGPVTAGAPGFMIPAFSNAIFGSVSPRISMWSKPRAVMPQAAGWSTMLVASMRPPMPTSSTATSTFCCTKTRSASSVMNSKKNGMPSSSVAFSVSVSNVHQKFSRKTSSSAGLPCSRMRSRMSTRCGEVYSPVRQSLCLSMLSTMQQVLPLPLVPAT